MNRWFVVLAVSAAAISGGCGSHSPSGKKAKAQAAPAPPPPSPALAPQPAQQAAAVQAASAKLAEFQTLVKSGRIEESKRLVTASLLKEWGGRYASVVKVLAVKTFTLDKEAPGRLEFASRSKSAPGSKGGIVAVTYRLVLVKEQDGWKIGS